MCSFLVVHHCISIFWSNNWCWLWKYDILYLFCTLFRKEMKEKVFFNTLAGWLAGLYYSYSKIKESHKIFYWRAQVGADKFVTLSIKSTTTPFTNLFPYLHFFSASQFIFLLSQLTNLSFCFHLPLPPAYPFYLVTVLTDSIHPTVDIFHAKSKQKLNSSNFADRPPFFFVFFFSFSETETTENSQIPTINLADSYFFIFKY